MTLAASHIAPAAQYANERSGRRAQKFLRASEKRYGDLYRLTMNLLNREHFTSDTNS